MELENHFILARQIPSTTTGRNFMTEDIDFQELGKSISLEIGLAPNEDIEIIDKSFQFDPAQATFYIVLTCRRKEKF